MKPIFIWLFLLGRLCATVPLEWNAIAASEGELDFLQQSADYIEQAPSEDLMLILFESDRLGDRRQLVVVALLCDTLSRRDGEAFQRDLVRSWATLDRSVSDGIMRALMTQQPLQTAGWVMQHVELQATWPDCMQQLIEYSPAVAARYFDLQLSQAVDVELRRSWAIKISAMWLRHAPELAVNWSLEQADWVKPEDLLENLSAMGIGSEFKNETLIWSLWEKMSETSRADALETGLAQRLATSYPEVALELAKGLDAKQRDSVFHQVLAAWGQQKSPKAVELMRSLPEEQLPGRNGDSRSVLSYNSAGLLMPILLQWGLREPEQAEAWTMTLSDSEYRDRLVLQMSTIWTLVDMDRALEHALSTPEGSLRRELIRNVAGALVRRDPAAGIEWVDALPESSGKQAALRDFVELADERDVWELLELAQAMQNGAARDGVEESLLSAWMEADIVASAEWLYEQAGGSREERLFGTLAYRLSFEEPALAMEWMVSGSVPLKARRALLQDFIHNNGDNASIMDAFVAQVLEPGLSPELVADLPLDSLGVKAPQVAIALSQMLPAGKAREQVVNRIVKRWAQERPAELVESVAAQYGSFTEFGVNPSVCFHIAATWAGADYDAAVDWVAGLTNDKERREAEYGMAQVLGQTAPQQGFNALQAQASEGGYQNSSSQASAYREIVRQWAYYEPQAASLAVAEAELSSWTREKLESDLAELGVNP
jgi:hypothetical protein